MSTPTRQFRRLSIGKTTPQMGSHPEEAPRTDDDSEHTDNTSEEDSDTEDDSGESLSMQGRSGITYDLANLDPESEARALIGLTSQFDVISCCSTKKGYDFQFADRPQVHLDSNVYTCTCSTFSSRLGVACQHIFNLLDQLYGYLLPQIPTFDILLASDGRPPNFSPIEQLLNGKLETVADQLSWQYVRSESDGGMSRPQKVQDIFSAFTVAILPEDVRLDLVDDSGQSRTPEQCVVQGDFEATMFRLAVYDDAVYSSLCKAMPPGACAAIYFDKVQERSRTLLADFDRFCQTGQRPSEETNLDVDHVIKELQHNVTRIQANITARAPHGMEGAAKALIALLEDICSRDKDALEGSRWGQTTFHGEDEDQRNLYHQLIGKTDETGECFILDTLEHLPGSDLHQFGSKLRAVLHKSEANRAPRAYILKLSMLVRRAESASTGSGQKRPATATSVGNDSKRTR